jgi:neutral ceramidase
VDILFSKVMALLGKEFGDLYTRDNVMLTPTHSHATPGGYHTYVLYGSPSEGFEMLTFRAAVDGIVKVTTTMLLNIFQEHG